MSVKEVGVEGRMGWLELLLSLKEMRMEPRKIETEFLFEVRIPQGPHHLIGDGPLGHRRITYPKAGAKVRGPRLNGEVLEGGGDPFLDAGRRGRGGGCEDHDPFGGRGRDNDEL